MINELYVKTWQADCLMTSTTMTSHLLTFPVADDGAEWLDSPDNMYKAIGYQLFIHYNPPLFFSNFKPDLNRIQADLRPM